jgi:hypothetical protein
MNIGTPGLKSENDDDARRATVTALRRRRRKQILKHNQRIAAKTADLNSTFEENRGLPARRGAPLGNRNAFKHGRFTRERLGLYAEVRAHIRRSRALVAEAMEAAR